MTAERDSTMTLEDVRDKLRAAGRFVIYQPNTSEALWAEDLADAIDAHLAAREPVKVTDEAVTRAENAYDSRVDSEYASSDAWRLYCSSGPLRAALESFAASMAVMAHNRGKESGKQIQGG